MKANILFLILFSLTATKVFANHIGCVTINDRSLCETEETYKYTSDSQNWEMPKDSFKDKLTSYINRFVPGNTARMANVFLWVNDFNMQSALRVHVWSMDKNYIIDMPSDVKSIVEDSEITVRGAGFLPYPLDFGHTLGELLVTCQGPCTDKHTEWLKAAGVEKTDSLLPNMLQAKVPAFNEAKMLAELKTKADFDSLFASIELSPVLEGNGFRSQAFTVYF